MTGRRYFGQQQVVDLLAYLRLLQNRYDDEALLTVLASPFVGVSNDALVLIRADASRSGRSSTASSASLPGDLAEDDRRLVLRVPAALRPARRGRRRTLSLELLCERILVEHDYDLAVLARRDGAPALREPAQARAPRAVLRRAPRRRHRGLRPLRRRAGGARRAGVATPCRRRRARDAVRLLTIHAAKGLEFKVVVVADAGRDPRPVRRDPLPLRRPLRLQGRASGDRARASARRRTRTSRRTRERAEQAERLRLYYVAMTRAMERLIVSGSVGPRDDAAEETPIAWVLGRLGLGTRCASGPPRSRTRSSAAAPRVLLRIDRGQQAAVPVVGR